MKIADNTPVLVGGGQFTQKCELAYAKNPIEMIVDSARSAARNAGIKTSLLEKIDTIATTSLAADAIGVDLLQTKPYTNMPRCIGDALGANLINEFAATTGGNTPQLLINEMAMRIKTGDSYFVLIAGAENFRSLTQALQQGVTAPLNTMSPGKPTLLGTDREPDNEHSLLYQLDKPIYVYPLFENAIRGKLKHSIPEHMNFMGNIFSGLSKVASENPFSWFPTFRSASELATITEENRWIGFPYPKYLNSILSVDMAASIIMMSNKRANELGIDESRKVYLNGFCDLHDKWHLTERVNYHSSPAMRAAGKQVFNTANTSMDVIKYMDLYSCFPSAVEVACQEFGIAFDDPRPFTVTGGLPYFGGPGNNYVMHAVVNMMDKLREDPGSNGFINANGWYLTKHSAAVYSTEPGNRDWSFESSTQLQEEINQGTSPDFAEKANGSCSIETYTVIHNGQTPERAIIVGLLDDNRRFFGITENNIELLNDMTKNEYLGVEATVTYSNGKNIIKF